MMLIKLRVPKATGIKSCLLVRFQKAALLTAVVASSLVLAPPARADCGLTPEKLAKLSASMRGRVPGTAAFQVERSDEFESQFGAKNDNKSKRSIEGFWKVTFTAAGATVNIGFEQFHPDGLENSVDSPAPATGNSCLGVWEKTGPARYVEVHPSFNWDVTTGKVVSIFVQRLEIILDRDGNRFTGKFTWDSYDFQGNVLPASHVDGDVGGERITARGPIPFPFVF